MTYIVIEGVIGVGKTVLTRLLNERAGRVAVFEQFEENPFLSNFYGDRARYAFQTEVFFLLNRYRQQQSAVKSAAESSNLVADYLFAKTRLFANMNLSGDERDLFDQIFDALARQILRPDLVVYLRAPLDTLMARIYERDRSFERGMDRSYIEMLMNVYEDFFSRYQDSALLTLETEKFDLVRDRAAQEAVIKQIDAAAAAAIAARPNAS